MIFRAFIEGNHSTFNYVFYDYFITSFPQAVHLRCTGKENYQIYQLTILNSNRGKENMTSIYVCILSPFRMYNFVIQQPAAPYSLAKIWRHRVHRIDSVCGLVYFYQTAHQKFNHHVFHRANFQLFCLKGTSPSRNDIGMSVKQPVDIWARSCENVSYAICEQQRRRSACASAQSDQRLCCSLLG